MRIRSVYFIAAWIQYLNSNYKQKLINQLTFLIRMNRFQVLLAIFLVSVSQNPIAIRYETLIAQVIDDIGYIQIGATGGTGHYLFQFNYLPISWTANASTLAIPGLPSIESEHFMINLDIKDQITGNILNGNFILHIAGVKVEVQSAGPDSLIFIENPDRQIQRISSVQSTSYNDLGNKVNQSSSSHRLQSWIHPTDYYRVPSQESMNINQLNNQIQTILIPQAPLQIPNPVPKQIMTSQSIYNFERNANELKIKELKQTKAFTRQINANKAIANAISRIKKLRNNVNRTQQDISSLRKLLGQAQNADYQCYQEMYNFENIRTKINNAIADKESTILTVNSQIEDYQATKEALQLQLKGFISHRNKIESKESPNADKLKKIQKELNDCQSERRISEAKLNKVNEEIIDIEIEIQNIKDSASEAPARIAQIDKQEIIIDRKIVDLKEELAKVEKQKLQIGIDREMYQQQIKIAEVEVLRQERQIARLKSKIPPLQSAIQGKNRICRFIQKQVNEFRNHLGEMQANYGIFLEQIQAHQALIDSKFSEIKSLQSSIKHLPNQLKLLRGELSRINKASTRQSYICQATAEDVINIQDNLSRMESKLDRQIKYLEEANKNLADARVEKELADQEVQQMIQIYTTALPFPLAHQPDTSSASTYLRTNDGGSIVQQESIPIGDLNTYLINQYGIALKTQSSETMTSLYPLSPTTTNTLKNQQLSGLVNSPINYPSTNLQNFQCTLGYQQLVGSGQIYSVQPGMIRIRQENNQIIELKVAGCTNLESTKPNHVLNSSDRVFYKGQISGNNQVNLQYMTCL